MKHRFRDVVTVLNAPEVSGYGGQEIRDWDHAVPYRSPAEVQPVSTMSGAIEVTDRRNLTITRWRMHVPALTPIDAASRVLWDDPDAPLEVDGEVELHKLRGVPHHVEVNLRRATDA